MQRNNTTPVEIVPYWQTSYETAEKKKLLTLINEGEEKFKNNLYDEAINKFNKVIEAKNNRDQLLKALAYYNRACCYYRKQQYKEVLTDYKQAIKLNAKLPKYNSAMNNMITCYKELGQYDQAVIIAEELVKRTQPSDDNFCHIYANLARLYYLVGKYNTATDTFAKLIDFDRTYYNAHIGLVNSLTQEGRHYFANDQKNEGIAMLQTALKYAEENSQHENIFIKLNSYYERATILKILGQYEEAIKIYKEIVEMPKNNFAQTDQTTQEYLANILALSQFFLAKLLDKNTLSSIEAKDYFKAGSENISHYLAGKKLTPENQSYFYLLAYAQQFGLGLKQNEVEAKKIYLQLIRGPYTDKLIKAKANKHLEQLLDIKIDEQANLLSQNQHTFYGNQPQRPSQPEMTSSNIPCCQII